MSLGHPFYSSMENFMYRPSNMRAIPFLMLIGSGCSSTPVAGNGSIDVKATSSVSIASAASTQTTALSSIAFLTWPDAECLVHPTNNGDPLEALQLYADADGIVQFSAVRTQEPTSVSLDCHDATGKTATFVLDLSAASTFDALAVSLPSKVPTRAALVGDPMSYSQSYLFQNGYGLRPDPTKAASRYAQFLERASKPAKLVRTSHPTNVTAFQSYDSGWGGGCLRTVFGTRRSSLSPFQPLNRLLTV